MMSYRQECSAGRLVGFVWVVFSPGQTDHRSLGNLEKNGQTPNFAKPQLITPESSFQEPDSGVTRTETQFPPEEHVGINAVASSPPSSRPHPPQRDDPEKSWKNGLTGAQPVDSAIAPPSTNERDVVEVTRGEIVVESEQYDTLLEYLLQTDFAGEELAAEHTRGWIQKTLEISKASAFGYSIRGEFILGQAPQTGPENSTSQPINVLTNLRKKRKADEVNAKVGAPADEQDSPVTPINTLSASLVRKKPKS